MSDNILYCSNKPGTFFVSKFLAEKNGEGRGGGGCGTAAAEKRKGFSLTKEEGKSRVVAPTIFLNMEC